MKKLTLIVSVLLFFVNLNAQIVKDTTFYFNQTFFADTSNTLTPAVEVLEDGYMLFGKYINQYDEEYVYMRKLDKVGNYLWQKEIDIEESGELGVLESGTQVCKTQFDTYYISLAKKVSSSATDWNCILYEYTKDGVLVREKEFGEPELSETTRVVLEDENRNVLLGGVSWNPVTESPNQMFLRLLNHNWEELWYKTYAINSGQLFSLKQTPWDGGFIFSGFSYTNDSMGFDARVIKVDSLGEVMWDKTIESENNDLAIRVENLIDLENFENGLSVEYLLIGGLDDPNHLTDVIPTVYKLNEFGEIIYEKSYPELNRTSSIGTVPLIIDKMLYVILRNKGENLLAKINLLNGDLEWTNLIKAEEDYNPNLYLKDLQPTPDGGYVMAGYHYSPLPQKSWVVKVDSLGNTCGFANCDSLVIVETIIEEPEDTVGVFIQNIENTDFQVYPNPASNSITVSFSNSVFERSRKYRIVNALGQQLLSGILTENDIINIEALHQGMYYIELSNGTTSRFVVLK